MKNSQKVQKIIVIFFTISIIIISYTYITYSKKDNSIPTSSQKINENATNSEKTDDNTTTQLKSLNYSENDITLIKKYVSQKNVEYLINNKINKTTAISFINETYYIDDYLEKYINYYNNHKSLSFKEIVTIINTHIDNDFYTNTIETDTTLGKYVLLNKYYKADNNYQGQNLVTVPREYNLYNTLFQLSEECYEAFLKLYEDAKEAGYAFKVNSAYRSYQYQIRIYNGWVSQDGVELADTYSARPGHSEHQTGYAFDIRDYPLTNDDYGKTKSFTWVSKNAHKYGFFIRFPEGKEHITGYQYEPWHYRYCGVECATYIYENDITFEEYYEYFIKYNNPRNLS